MPVPEALPEPRTAGASSGKCPGAANATAPLRGQKPGCWGRRHFQGQELPRPAREAAPPAGRTLLPLLVPTRSEPASHPASAGSQRGSAPEQPAGGRGRRDGRGAARPGGSIHSRRPRTRSSAPQGAPPDTCPSARGHGPPAPPRRAGPPRGARPSAAPLRSAPSPARGQRAAPRPLAAAAGRPGRAPPPSASRRSCRERVPAAAAGGGGEGSGRSRRRAEGSRRCAEPPLPGAGGTEGASRSRGCAGRPRRGAGAR